MKVILTFDLDGLLPFGREDEDIIKEGTKRIVEFLKENNIDATFFVVGKNLEKYPEAHKPIKRYELGNHSYSHNRNFGSMEKEAIKKEIEKTHILIKNFSKTPKIFRAPDYSISGKVFLSLHELGYKIDSSILDVTIPFKYKFSAVRGKFWLDNASIKEFPLLDYFFPLNVTTIYKMRFLEKLFFKKISKRENSVINFHCRDFVNKDIPAVGFEKFFYTQRNEIENFTKNLLSKLIYQAEFIGSFKKFFKTYGKDF